MTDVAGQTVLVTGATGFVGRALCTHLAALGYSVRAAVRHAGVTQGMPVDEQLVIGLDAQTDWVTALAGVNMVVHLAARVHVMAEQSTDPQTEFRRTNVQGTLRLAEQAVQAGVRRFVYISSIKAMGETTSAGQPFTEESPTVPLDAYGFSKLEAEMSLHKLAADTGLEVVIVRPPLVYGPGVKANFAALMRAVEYGVPLPLGAVHNARSLVSLSNLVDFIATCMAHAQAANQTFLVSDGQDLSTTGLVRAMAQVAGVKARLLSVPIWILEVVASLLGKRDVVQRLCGTLQVDITKARTLLHWKPPVQVYDGLVGIRKVKKHEKPVKIQEYLVQKQAGDSMYMKNETS